MGTWYWRRNEFKTTADIPQYNVSKLDRGIVDVFTSATSFFCFSPRGKISILLFSISGLPPSEASTADDQGTFLQSRHNKGLLRLSHFGLCSLAPRSAPSGRRLRRQQKTPTMMRRHGSTKRTRSSPAAAASQQQKAAAKPPQQLQNR